MLPQPDSEYWQSELTRASQERLQADELSGLRANLAEPLGNLVALAYESRFQRIASGLSLAAMWYTDRLDGMKGRQSSKRAQAIQDSGIENIASDPQVTYLADPSTTIEGGEKDNLADKIFINSINSGLLVRNLREGTFITALGLAGSNLINKLRDEQMRKVRDEGKEKGVDIRANRLGKAKTAMQAAGSIIATSSHPHSKTHKIGIGIIASSTLPSVGAYIQLRSKVKKASTQET